MKILFLRAGIYSYLNFYFYDVLRQHFNVVANVDAGRVIKRKSLNLTSLFNLAATLLFSRRHWRQTHSKNSFAFTRMSEYCNNFVKAQIEYDIILQTQCKFTITANPRKKPYYIYTDLTQKLTDRVWTHWALRSIENERARWYRLESEAYERATKIFTFNDYVKKSFVHDYGINEEKIVVVGSGINNTHWTDINVTSKFDGKFTLFFLSTEFERHGGPAVLKAFELAGKKVRNLKLIVGGKCPIKSSENLQVYNNLSRNEIENLMNTTDIFLSPGCLGGVQSVLEAMSKKCACIVSDSNFLLRDIIINESTGFTVPLNNAEKLAERIVDLCNDATWAAKIALQGYEHAVKNYSWDVIVRKMSRHFPTSIVSV